MEVKMQVYLIKGQEDLKRTEFSSLLSKKLAEESETILIGINRNKENNIEDYYKKDGMIVYDLDDYFLGYCDFDRVVNKESDKLSFIMAPLVEDKFEIKKENIDDILEKLQDKIIVFDELNEDLIDEKITISIIEDPEECKNLSCDYFFIQTKDENFDPRIYREEIINAKGKYLGFLNENESYEKIFSNLLNDREKEVEKIGFFEKIKMKFKK